MQNFLTKKLQISLGLTACFAVCFFASSANAVYKPAPARDPGYAAKFISQSVLDPIYIEAGDTKTVEIKFKNVGTKTWEANGNRYISAYTRDPKYRESDFAGNNWIGRDQTAKIPGTVKPGEYGILTLNVKAPQTEGKYIEKFQLASDGWTWVQDGGFFLQFNVIPGTKTEEPEDVVEVKDGGEEEDNVEKYKGKLIVMNKRKVSAIGGEKIKIVAVFRNLGSEDWNKFKIVKQDSSSLASTDISKLSFADSSWKDVNTVLSGSKSVAPERTLRQIFYFRTPSNKGEYIVSFKLAVDGNDVEDAIIELPVTVTSDAPSHYKPPTFTTKKSSAGKPRFDREPKIRVGLWRDPEKEVNFRSNDDEYQIFEGYQLRGILPKSQLAKLDYKDGLYHFSSKKLNFESSQYLRLIPKNNKRATFYLQNYTRLVKWKGPTNFNKYHGGIEFRLTQDKENLYVINELLFEDYVDGIAETSNYAHEELQKAQSIVARTYAYYIKKNSNKHEKRNFDVVAHTGDQLYLGVINEDITPNYVKAARYTRGKMVTYDTDDDSDTDSDIVITPYFGNTDGRTRSWTEVWGGKTKPWLVSVKAEYDKGRRLYGHGVGMSQRDANYRADDGANWKELLEHYYTGIEVEQIYK